MEFREILDEKTQERMEELIKTLKRKETHHQESASKKEEPQVA